MSRAFGVFAHSYAAAAIAVVSFSFSFLRLSLLFFFSEMLQNLKTVQEAFLWNRLFHVNHSSHNPLQKMPTSSNFL